MIVPSLLTVPQLVCSCEPVWCRAEVLTKNPGIQLFTFVTVPEKTSLIYTKFDLILRI